MIIWKIHKQSSLSKSLNPPCLRKVNVIPTLNNGVKTVIKLQTGQDFIKYLLTVLKNSMI